MRGESHGSDVDARGVSITLNYILALAISALLVTGLLVAGGQFVTDQREHVIEGELNIIGHHIANNLETVDRLVTANSGDDPDVAYVNQTFRAEVTGTSYTIQLEENPDQVVLTSQQPRVTVRVNVTVQTELEPDSFAGAGTISVQYDPDAGSDGRLVVDNA